MSVRDTGPRLGRGLAALLGDIPGPAPAIPSDTAAIRSLALDLLEPGPFQPRGSMDPAALMELAVSIRASGVLQPLLVRAHPAKPGRYEIIAGERRWRAAQSAGLHEAPVHLRALSDEEAAAAALVENLQRLDLNAVEEAEGYRRLTEEFSLTHERLAAAVGKSRSHISNTLRLLQLPQSVLGEVRVGSLSAGHARALLGHPEPAKAALAVIAGGLNVRQTEALASSPAIRGPTQKKSPDPDTEALERDLTARLGLKVEIQSDGRGGGSLRVRYRTLDQLDGLIKLLTAAQADG